MHNLHNLKRFDLLHDDGSIDIYLPRTIGRIETRCCPWSWIHNQTYFSGLTTCLYLDYVPLSNEWFNSFSRNFPCLEELRLKNCNGFDEMQLSSPSIKNLNIWLDEKTTKATVDAPSIKTICFGTNIISQSISFTTTSSEWKSQLHLTLDQLDASQKILTLSEIVAAFSQSQISLVLYHSSLYFVERLSDISGCCGGSYKPVAMKSLDLNFVGRYYDSFFSDLMNGLFCIFRPREIKQSWCNNARQERERNNNEVVEFLCRTLQMGRWEEEEDQGMRRFCFWQQDLEEVSLQVRNGSEGWRPVQGTINWSEYVAVLLPQKTNKRYCELRFRLKWRE